MKIQDRGIYVIFLLAFIFSAIKFTMQFYLPVFYVDLGFDAIQIGFLISIGLGVNILLSSLTGFLSDRHDLRIIVLIPLILFLIFFAGMLTTTEFLIIALLVISFRAATLFSKMGLENLTLKLKQEKSKNKIIGYLMFFSFFGVMVGMVGGGYLIENLSFEDLFSILSIILIILIPLVYFLPKIDPSNPELHEYKNDIFKKKFIPMLVVLFLFSMHFGAEHSSYSLFLIENLNLDLSSVGLFMGSAIFFMAFAALFAGNFITAKNSHMFLGVGLFLSGLGHILMPQEEVLFSLIARIIHEIGDAFFFVSYLVFLKDTFNLKRVGGNSGIFATMLTVGAFISGFIFSIIGFDYGHEWSLILSGILVVLGSLIFLYFYELKKILKD